jgi:hypothetical protein
LPVEVNGRSIKMILDTGALLTGLGQAATKSLQLPKGEKAYLKGNGESNLPITITKNVTFRLGGVDLLEKSVVIVPYEDLEAHEGRTIDGVLGVDLFLRYVVEIDYAARTLALYEPKDFVYPGSGQKVPLDQGNDALFNASISVPGGGSIPAKLSVDSGTYSALRLYGPFVAKNGLLSAQTSVIDSFDFGIGGEFPEKLGRVAALEIGTLKISGPVTSFSVAKGGATSSSAYDGTIGGAILSRFKVTFDYSRRQMFLEPNSEFGELFQADASGVLLEAGEQDLKTLTIRHVLPNTPAAEAGIKQGDVVDEVDGKNAGSLGVEGIRALFCQPGVYQLKVRRQRQNIDLTMRTTKPLY